MNKKTRPVISTRQREERVARYMKEVTEMQDAGLSRRDLFKMGLTAGVGGLVTLGGGRSFLPNLADAASFPGAKISPVLSPSLYWTEDLVIPKTALPCSVANGLSGQFNHGLVQSWKQGDMIGPLPSPDAYAGSVDLPKTFLDDLKTKMALEGSDLCDSMKNGVFSGFTDARFRALLEPNPVTGNSNPKVSGQDPLSTAGSLDRFQRWEEILNGVAGGYTLQNVANPYYANLPKNDVYELFTREVKWNFYPKAANLGPSSVWVFNDMHSDAAGLLRINAQYGKPVLMRMYNMMCETNHGCGINQQSTHLHNGHTPSESDGGPLRFFDAGEYRDYWYPNLRSGFSSTHKSGTSYTNPLTGKSLWCPGDYRETQSTLWFHDHRMDYTSQNVYKGLASFYTLFSEDINLDSGNELDPAKRGLGLPANRARATGNPALDIYTQFDIPLLFTDKSFDSNGEMFFDLNDKRGMIGDQVTVNFKIKPKLTVAARRYRFRFLDAGPSRWYQFALTDSANKTKMAVLCIGADGNLYERAQSVTDMRMGVAERRDVIVDFGQLITKYKLTRNAVTGKYDLYLHNILEQTTPQGNSGALLALSNDTRVLKIEIDPTVVVDDPTTPVDTAGASKGLSALTPLLPLPLLPGEAQAPMTAGQYDPAAQKKNRDTAIAALLKNTKLTNRAWDFGSAGGNWVVNGNLFDPAVMNATIAKATGPTSLGEIWKLTAGNGWNHPIHHHHDESLILTRDGKTTGMAPDEVGVRKDVYRIGQGVNGSSNSGQLQFYLQFRDWTGDYVMHCHNVVHEDHAMMIRFKIV